MMLIAEAVGLGPLFGRGEAAAIAVMPPSAALFGIDWLILVPMMTLDGEVDSGKPVCA